MKCIGICISSQSNLSFPGDIIGVTPADCKSMNDGSNGGIECRRFEYLRDDGREIEFGRLAMGEDTSGMSWALTRETVLWGGLLRWKPLLVACILELDPANMSHYSCQRSDGPSVDGCSLQPLRGYRSLDSRQPKIEKARRIQEATATAEMLQAGGKTGK